MICTGARGLSTATGRPGGPEVQISGLRGTVTGAGRPGCERILLTGGRGLATATGRPGHLGSTATPQFTVATEVTLSDDGATVISLPDSRTLITNNSGRTKATVP